MCSVAITASDGTSPSYDPAEQAVLLGGFTLRVGAHLGVNATGPLGRLGPIPSGVARSDDDDQVDAILAAVGHQPDDARAAAAAEARSRGRWLRQQAAESSTLAGVLLALAERGSAVTLHGGRWSHSGRLHSVTAALAIVVAADALALVPMDAITLVEAGGMVADDRAPAAGGPDLAAVLAAFVPERPTVRLLLGDGNDVAGTLIELGKDVAMVRITSGVATVRLAAIVGCLVPTRGSNAGRGPRQSGVSGGDLASPADFGSG